MGDSELEKLIREVRGSDRAYRALRAHVLDLLARQGVAERVADLVWHRVLAELLQRHPPFDLPALVRRELLRVRGDLPC